MSGTSPSWRPRTAAVAKSRGGQVFASQTACRSDRLVTDDDTAPLPELNGFFTWGSEDEPAPYAPHRDMSQGPPPPDQGAATFLDVVPLPNPSKRQEWVGRLIHLRQNWRRPPVPLMAAGIVAVLIALTAWGLSGNDESANHEITADPTFTPPVTTTTTQTATAPEPVAIDPRLSALLPPDYPPGACRPLRAPREAVAVAECGPNAAAPGTSARYTLFSDSQKLKAALDQMIKSTTTQTCPGNYMSPGAWRRTTNPDVPAGTLVCGTRQDNPTVGWTLDDALLLAAITSTPSGPTLADLYTWWSTHS